METLILTRQHVAKLVQENGRDHFMDRMIFRLEEAFTTPGREGVTPSREGFLRGPDDTAILEWMPHHQPGSSITIKTVGYTPTNPEKFQLPTIIGSAAIAGRLLARPDSKVLGLVGAGAQAVTQAHALSRVFPIEQILVYDVDASHAASYASRVDFLGAEVRVATLAELEAQSDIICTVTSVGVGEGPVLPGENLRPHVHINAIGADLIGKFEIPKAVLTSSFVTADHVGQALREGESQQLEESDLGPDLPALCADPESAEPLRERTTVFDSTGFALEDHVAFDVFLELAEEAGIGDRVELEHLPEDALNPYSFE